MRQAMTPAQAQWKAAADRASKAELEALLAQDLQGARIAFQHPFRFHPKRRWKADFAICNTDMLVEIEGGTYIHRTGKTFVGKDGKHHEVQSRHLTPTGFHNDCEKYNQAALMGFRVLRFDAKMVRSGEAFLTIKQAVDLWREESEAKIQALAEAAADSIIEAALQSDLRWLQEYEKEIPRSGDDDTTEEEDAGDIWTAEDQWREQIQNR